MPRLLRYVGAHKKKNASSMISESWSGFLPGMNSVVVIASFLGTDNGYVVAMVGGDLYFSPHDFALEYMTMCRGGSRIF